MKFLIMGAAGFIGRHTLALVRAQGLECLGADLQACPERGVIELDLARDRLLEKVPAVFFQSKEPVFVVISAGITKIDTCFREPALTRTVNVTNTLRLMEDAAALGARSVYLTSSAVFDGRAGNYSEEDSPAPLSEYGRQKAEIERYCRERHPEWLLLRLDKIVGDDPAENHLFSEWWRWTQAGQPIVCMANQLFSPTAVDDVAHAILLGCRQGLSGLYNLAASEVFTRDDLARRYCDILGVTAKIVSRTQAEIGFAELRPEKSHLNGARFTAATGMHCVPMRQVIGRFRGKLELDGSKG